MYILFNRDQNGQVSQLNLLMMSCLMILIVFMAGWSAILAAETMNEETYFSDYKNRYAFVVGISHYENLPCLEGATHDAKAVAKILEERYGFHTLQLISDDSQRITKTVLETELDNFKAQIKDASDSLFVFYYSGHGFKDAIVPVDGTDDDLNTVLPFTVLAEKIAAYKTHHTLLILDACSSGTIFNSKKVKNTLKKYLSDDVKSISDEGGGLERAFSLPVVQAITAGTGDEIVADEVQLSTDYSNMRAQEAVSLSQYSPFTAMLIQALAGRIGIEQQNQIRMGTIPGSMLGAQLYQLLTANKQLEKTDQLPHYARLAGEGDILLMPKKNKAVLNPRLVGPLYLLDSRYQSLRASAIEALLSKEEQTKQEFVIDALPHLTYALSDTAIVQEAALEALTQWVEKNGPIANFQVTISSLAKILNTTEANDLLKKKAAELLGKLPTLANENAVVAMKQYVNQLLKKWELKKSEFTEKDFPHEVIEQENIATLKIETEKFQQAMTHLEKRYQAIQWLLVHGLVAIEEYAFDLSRKNIKELDESIETTSSEVNTLKEKLNSLKPDIEETQDNHKDLLRERESSHQQLSEISYEYQSQKAQYRNFKRRFDKANVTLNRLFEYFEQLKEQREQLKQELRKIEDSIQKSLQRKEQKEKELNNVTPSWRNIDKLFQSYTKKFELDAERKKCHKMLAETTERLDELPNYKLVDSLRKRLKEKIGKLNSKCEEWNNLYQSTPTVNWNELRKNLGDLWDSTAEWEGWKAAGKTLSPTIHEVTRKIKAEETEIEKEEQIKSNAEKDRQKAEEEMVILQQKDKETQTQLQNIDKEINATQKRLDDLKEEQARQQTLVDNANARLEKLKRARKLKNDD
jgi:hypothetical protein